VTSNYVITMLFETDAQASGVAKAAAWLTLQGKGVELDTIVGDAAGCSVFYTVAQEKAPALTLSTGELKAVDPATYVFEKKAA